MSKHALSRRSALRLLGAAAGAPLLGASILQADRRTAATPTADSTFTFALNTSTIRGQNLDLITEIEIAAEAGYHGIEIWIDRLRAYAENASLSELKQRIDDLGIRVEGAIGFSRWIVGDNDVRSLALDELQRDMDLLAAIGCRRIAAPPAGATEGASLDLRLIAERFRSVVDLGTRTGVMPQLEIWGFSKNLSRLSELLYVAAECGHPDTRILPDVYHLYRGGSDLDGLRLVNGASIEVFHLNDYPSNKTPAEIQDADRVLPGDGDAPLGEILSILHATGSPIVLSLELFSRAYWDQDPLEVARLGLRKMRATVDIAMG